MHAVSSHRPFSWVRHLVVGALVHAMAGLFAGVAQLLAATWLGLTAVLGHVTILAAVVALLALDTLAWIALIISQGEIERFEQQEGELTSLVAETSTRVAGGSAAAATTVSSTSAIATTSSIAAVISTLAIRSSIFRICAVAGNVADLSALSSVKIPSHPGAERSKYLVAFLATTSSVASTTGTTGRLWVRAIASQVARLIALIARLWLLGLAAVTAQMTRVAAVVALGSSSIGAIAFLMLGGAA